nr:hypothetical protein [Myxococcota bacterium]
MAKARVKAATAQAKATPAAQRNANDPLEGVLAALRDEQHAAALEGLLAAWATTPRPELAALVH